MRMVLCRNELRRNPDRVRIPPHAALEHVLHAQLTPDLVQRRPAALVPHHGGPGDHAQALGVAVPQLHDHLFREAVAEILLPSVPGEVLKGQHGEHDPLCPGSWRA